MCRPKLFWLSQTLNSNHRKSSLFLTNLPSLHPHLLQFIISDENHWKSNLERLTNYVGPTVIAVTSRSGTNFPLCNPAVSLPQTALQSLLENLGRICVEYMDVPGEFTLQGRRNYQEDRTLFRPALNIPFPGNGDVKVGIFGVFDGHNGDQASDFASQNLLDCFLLHVQNSTKKLLNHKHLAMDVKRNILKESLLMAVQDIDAKFSEEATKNNITAGSTAVVVLLVDNQLLVANVGDSKAILCSETVKTEKEKSAAREKFYRQRRSQGDPTKKYQPEPNHFSVTELTRDHHPDRDDELSRIEATLGGFVEDSRVNGELAVSRSIGDVPFKRYGVICTPEVTEWRPLSANDTYLVVASDGIVEKMTTQDVGDVLWDLYQGKLDSYKGSSLAECVVNAAFESGSADNLSAIVVPLK